jgi:predicted transposase/invertase (TIGR01784 family)
MSENHDIIRATSDIFIASLLSAPKNEPILRGMINAVLENCGGVPVKSAQVLNPINIKEHLYDKGIVLDVRVKDEREQIYNIEVQTSQHPAFMERILFGWADTFSAQLHAGNAYTKLQPVFCIVITEFNIFPGESGVHFVFELRERTRPNLMMSNHLAIHCWRLYDLLNGKQNSLENEKADFRHWTNFLVFGGTKEENEMAQLLDNDPVLMEAVGELKRYSSDPEMQELERRRKLWKLEQESGLFAAKTEVKANSVIRALSRKYTVPKTVTDKIRAISSIEQLDDLLDLAYECVSLEEFKTALK